MSVDISFIISRVKAVFTNPKGVWDEVKAEPGSVRDIYFKYVLVLAAIPAICGFVGMTVFGMSLPFVGTVRWPFFSGLVAAVVEYGMSLLGVYIAAMVIEKLAPKFGGQVSIENALKLVVNAGIPSYVAGVLSLIPSLSFLGLFFGIFSIYVFFQGVTPMTGVGDDSRIKYAIVSAIGIFIVMIVIRLVSAPFMPATPVPNFEGKKVNIPNLGSIDTTEFQKSMEHLQKALPKQNGQ